MAEFEIRICPSPIMANVSIDIKRVFLQRKCLLWLSAFGVPLIHRVFVDKTDCYCLVIITHSKLQFLDVILYQLRTHFITRVVFCFCTAGEQGYREIDISVNYPK